MRWPFKRRATDPVATGKDVATVHSRIDRLEDGIRANHLEYLRHLDGHDAEIHALQTKIDRIHSKLDKALGKRKKG